MQSQNLKKNIIVVGYPKSGTVWATRLVAELMDCPTIGFWGLDKETPVSEGADRISNYCCYHAHHLYNNIQSASMEPIHKIIYIVRDPRDIIVSGAFDFMFYYTFLRDKKILKLVRNLYFGKWIKILYFKAIPLKFRVLKMYNTLRFGAVGMDYLELNWGEHLKSYLNRDILIIRYEDLLSDSLNTAKEILRYLSYNKSEERIKEDIAKQSFKNKKKEFELKGERVRAKHLRKGESGKWGNYITIEQSEIIKKDFSQMMKYFNYS